MVSFPATPGHATSNAAACIFNALRRMSGPFILASSTRWISLMLRAVAMMLRPDPFRSFQPVAARHDPVRAGTPRVANYGRVDLYQRRS